MSDLNPNQSGSTAEQEQLHKQGTDYIKDQVQKAQFSDDGTGKGRKGDTFDSPVSNAPTSTGSGGAGDSFDRGVSDRPSADQSGPGNTFDKPKDQARTETENETSDRGRSEGHAEKKLESEASKNSEDAENKDHDKTSDRIGSEGHAEKESESQAPKSSSDPKTMENKDAIPTAGGQRLGEEHWGESKIVPENPKPQGDEGVASGEGQPDSETANNTAKNAGGASSGNGEGKQSFIDKVKEKLPIGHKKE